MDSKDQTELNTGGQRVKFWTTGRQSENGTNHRWVYYNLLKKELVHQVGNS